MPGGFRESIQTTSRGPPLSWAELRRGGRCKIRSSAVHHPSAARGCVASIHCLMGVCMDTHCPYPPAKSNANAFDGKCSEHSPSNSNAFWIFCRFTSNTTNDIVCCCYLLSRTPFLMHPNPAKKRHYHQVQAPFHRADCAGETTL